MGSPYKDRQPNTIAYNFFFKNKIHELEEKSFESLFFVGLIGFGRVWKKSNPDLILLICSCQILASIQQFLFHWIAFFVLFFQIFHQLIPTT